MVYTQTDSTIKNSSYVARLKLWITGISSYYVLTYLYDYIVISFLLVYFGFKKGTILAMILSVLVDLGTLKFYDWFKKDWLALETLKDLQYKKNFWGRLFTLKDSRLLQLCFRSYLKEELAVRSIKRLFWERSC